MPKYFHELTLQEMFEHHDHTYQYSDDHRSYKRGSQEYKIIQDKVKEMGGWNEKLVELWNKYAPNHDSFQKDWEWIKKYE
tara:strand:- start:79 stop:318 length:240 start_codon:yes stop_codon:yes gene_type:complete